MSNVIVKAIMTMDSRRLSMSMISIIEITSMDVINTSSEENENIATKDWWTRNFDKITFIQQSFKLPSQIPTQDIIAARSKQIENILLNKCCKDNPSRTSYTYILLGILLGVACSLIATSYSQHYPIGYPKYWYENLLVVIFGWGPAAATEQMNLYFFCMGISGKKTVRTCVAAYGYGTLAACITSGGFYIIWVHLFGLPSPMPFQGYITAVVAWYAMFVVFWCQSSNQWGTSSNIRNKLMFCLLFLNMLYAVELSYKVIHMLFIVIPSYMHWILVIVLIAARELHVWGLSYLGQKIAGYPDLSVEIAAAVTAVSRYSIFLLVHGGSIMNPATGYAVLAIDMLINLICCFTIMWCNQNVSVKNRKRQVKATLNLIINESVEFIMPITYGIVLLLAYFGPNGEILGNIKSNLWHYTSIENIGDTLTWIAIMFSVDFLSLIASITLLKCFCKMDIVRMYLQVQDQMGHILVIVTGYMVTEVSTFLGWYHSTFYTR